MKKYEFVVMVCYYGDPCRPHRECIDAIKAAGIPFCPIYDCPYLDIARSHALTAAMDQVPEAKGFVFIDHDIHNFSVRDVVDFAERAIERQLDVVGGAYSMRRPGMMVCAQPEAEDRDVTFGVPGYEPAKYVATGFMFLARNALEALDVKNLYVQCVDQDVRMYFEPWIENGGYYPDDVGICYRMQAHGRKVWIDTQLSQLMHRGKYDYMLADSGLSVPNFTGPLTVQFRKKAEPATMLRALENEPGYAKRRGGCSDPHCIYCNADVPHPAEMSGAQT